MTNENQSEEATQAVIDSIYVFKETVNRLIGTPIVETVQFGAADKVEDEILKLTGDMLMQVYEKTMDLLCAKSRRSFGGGGKSKILYENIVDYFFVVAEESPENIKYKNIWDTLNHYKRWDWKAEDTQKAIIQGHTYETIEQLKQDGIIEEKENAAPTSKGRLMTGYRLTKEAYEKMKKAKNGGVNP